jgi:hypothetical protein
VTYISWFSLVILSNGFHIQAYGALYLSLLVLGGLGPMLAAFAVKKFFTPNEEFKQFIKDFFRVKVSYVWYLWMIFLPFVINSIPWFVNLAKGITGPLFIHPAYMILVFIPTGILGGGLEEIGWRGFLLPELLKKQNLWLSTIVVGCLWTLWHLPLFFLHGSPQASFNFLYFFISLLSLSFIFTILYTKTKSIILCIFMHVLTDAFAMNLGGSGIFSLLNVTTTLVFAVVVFVIFLRINSREASSSPSLSI